MAPKQIRAISVLDKVCNHVKMNRVSPNILGKIDKMRDINRQKQEYARRQSRHNKVYFRYSSLMLKTSFKYEAWFLFFFPKLHFWKLMITCQIPILVHFRSNFNTWLWTPSNTFSHQKLRPLVHILYNLCI